MGMGVRPGGVDVEGTVTITKDLVGHSKSLGW